LRLSGDYNAKASLLVLKDSTGRKVRGRREGSVSDIGEVPPEIKGVSPSLRGENAFQGGRGELGGSEWANRQLTVGEGKGRGERKILIQTPHIRIIRNHFAVKNSERVIPKHGGGERGREGKVDLSPSQGRGRRVLNLGGGGNMKDVWRNFKQGFSP